ncbi:MAG: TetR/AcrR family transcriptional regulator [Clostridia bacterium]
MNKNRNDSRYIRKTKRIFENALIELLKKNSINQITVKELSEKVEMSRSTFYAYYDDIYSLLEEIEDRVIEELSQIIKHDLSDLKNSNSISNRAFEYMKENEQIFKALLGSNGSPTFIEKLKKMISLQVYEDIKALTPELGEPYAQIVHDFFISGAVGLIQSWVKNGADVDLHIMVTSLDKLKRASMDSFEGVKRLNE